MISRESSDAPERGGSAYDVVRERCPRCGGILHIEVSTDGNGHLVETPRPCPECQRLEAMKRRQLTTEQTHAHARRLFREDPSRTAAEVYELICRIGVPSMKPLSFQNATASKIRREIGVSGPTTPQGLRRRRAALKRIHGDLDAIERHMDAIERKMDRLRADVADVKRWRAS